MNKYLMIGCGLPGVGKTTLMKQIGEASYEHDFGFGLYNSGDYRRSNPRFGWLKSADDFKNYPEILDEISSETLSRGLQFLNSNDENVVLGFDQTFTRKTSRQNTWSAMDSLQGIPFIVVEIYTTEQDKELFEGFQSKADSGDYENLSHDEAIEDFIRRFAIYREGTTHFSDDEFFQTHQPAYVRLDRAKGSIEIGNEDNTSPELVDIVVEGMEKVNRMFGHSTQVVQPSFDNI